MIILLKNLDGSVGIMYPVLDCGLTLEQIIEKDVPKGVAYEIVEDSAIPADRTFRNAWKHDLTVDTPKAQEITKERLRRERVEAFKPLDIIATTVPYGSEEYLANEAKRQVLRDVTKIVDTLTTVEELKKIKVV